LTLAARFVRSPATQPSEIPSGTFGEARRYRKEGRDRRHRLVVVVLPHIAHRLRGKHKATFTPHVDDGDNVIVVNAAKVVFTGRKRDQKNYYHHTGFIGGIKERSAKSIFEGRFPERILEKAVERMLPRGPLGRKQLGNLRVYPGAEHPHEAQKPQALDVGAMNRKNKAA
jgi:large subunit ribosomal protein L13